MTELHDQLDALDEWPRGSVVAIFIRDQEHALSPHQEGARDASSSLKP